MIIWHRKRLVLLTCIALGISLLSLFTVLLRNPNYIFKLSISSKTYVEISTYKRVPSKYDHSMDRISALSNTRGENILFVFTGRWQFLRIQFLYFFKNVRENGGIIDKIYYMMVNYDSPTQNKLHSLAQVVNKALNRTAIEIRYLGFEKGKSPMPKDHYGWQVYPKIYYEILDELFKENPYNRYFKIDDDIIYIYPSTFENMVVEKDSSQCFIHFANIVNNRRCNTIHERMGLFDNPRLNPKGLKFDYEPYGHCGWKSAECAELVLRTFVELYDNNLLDKYLWDGLELTVDRQRISIHLFMLDKDLIDIEMMQKVGKIYDDEQWWSHDYSRRMPNPNCVMGQTLVVHFSYFTTTKAMLDLDILPDFERIAMKEFDSEVPLWLNDILEY